jgi:hypothetical protein
MNGPPRESLANLHHALEMELVWIYAKWRQFEGVFAAPAADIQVLNKTAPDFFVQAREALIDDILLSLCRITDRPRSGGLENFSLGQLANHAEVQALPDLARNLARLTSQAEALVEFARQRRNKRLAHSDLPTVLRPEDNPLLPYKRSNVNDALTAISAVVSRVQRHLTGGDGYYDDAIGFGDSHRLFQYLRAGIAAERARRMREGIPEPLE